MRFRRLYYAKQVMNKTKWSFAKTYLRMQKAKSNFNVSFRDYYEKEYYLFPETSAQRVSQSISTHRKEAIDKLEGIAKREGVTREFLVFDKDEFCKLYRVGLNAYLKWRIFDMSAEEKVEMAEKFRLHEELRANLIESAIQSKRDSFSGDAIQKEIANYIEFLKTYIPDTTFAECSDELTNITGELSDDLLSQYVYDMEMSRYVLGFSHKEYLMFRMWEKSFEEKMTFIPNSLHTGILLSINGSSLVNLCNEKYESYNFLKKYYARDFVRVTSKKDYSAFEKFIAEHDYGVFKPLTQTKGEGVRLLDFSKELPSRDSKSIKKYMSNLYDLYGDFILEGLIIANEEFKKINPDAINTVRALVYYDGKDARRDAALFRVGRLGSFVDNGSVGGILMNVDTETGIVKTAGANQEGFFFDKHPDTGFVFTNYQLPDWEKAKILLNEVARAIGPGYIGWDITYTDKGEWIVVEANGTPQLYAIQSTTGKGALPHFVETVGDKAFDAYCSAYLSLASKYRKKATNKGVLHSK